MHALFTALYTCVLMCAAMRGRLLQEGSVYKVRVVKLMDYGAFVELPNGFQALLHISELEHERVRTPVPASLRHIPLALTV